MKQFSPSQLRIRSIIAAAAVAAALSFVFVGCAGATRQKAKGTTVTPVATRTPLTGAELYAINCNRCHPERSAIERKSTEWKTILTHMRVRANLPAAQARTILQYLQENSGS